MAGSCSQCSGSGGSVWTVGMDCPGAGGSNRRRTYRQRGLRRGGTGVSGLGGGDKRSGCACDGYSGSAGLYKAGG